MKKKKGKLVKCLKISWPHQNFYFYSDNKIITWIVWFLSCRFVRINELRLHWLCKCDQQKGILASKCWKVVFEIHWFPWKRPPFCPALSVSRWCLMQWALLVHWPAVLPLWPLAHTILVSTCCQEAVKCYTTQWRWLSLDNSGCL